jgi:hypothetical protein
LHVFRENQPDYKDEEHDPCASLISGLKNLKHNLTLFKVSNPGCISRYFPKNIRFEPVNYHGVVNAPPGHAKIGNNPGNIKGEHYSKKGIKAKGLTDL